MVSHLVTTARFMFKLDRILTEEYLVLFQVLNSKRKIISHRQQLLQISRIPYSTVSLHTIKMMMENPSVVEGLKCLLQEYEILSVWFYIPMETCTVLTMDQISAMVSNDCIAIYPHMMQR